MARRWNTNEEKIKREELLKFYVKENRSIKEVGLALGIAESTVFDRMMRLGIPSSPDNKRGYCNKRFDIAIPKFFSNELAEFVGVMLGDGHVSKTQISISVAKTEKEYIPYLGRLIKNLFHVSPKITTSAQRNTYDLYVGSVDIVKYLKDMGLVGNKVQYQVDVPEWIFKTNDYQKSFLRGFCDTDGSLYKLRYGTQLNFCNRSLPLLEKTRVMLTDLEFHPSKITHSKLYLTRQKDLKRYTQEIGFSNPVRLAKAKQFGIVSYG